MVSPSFCIPSQGKNQLKFIILVSKNELLTEPTPDIKSADHGGLYLI